MTVKSSSSRDDSQERGRRGEAGTEIEPVNSGFADRGLTTWLPRRYPRPSFDERAFVSHPLVSPVRQLLAAFPICPNLSACLGDQLRIAPNNEKTEHQYYPDGRKVNGKPMALLLGVSHL